MRSATRELTSDGRAVRALARSGLSVLRVPQDLPILVRRGLPDPETVGLPSLLRLGLIAPVARGLYEVRTPAGVTRGSFADLLAGRFADTPHLVTGWWALADANLTNQDVRRVTVLTATNRRTTTIAGHVVQPVPNTDELWGAIRRPNGLVVARPERAL